VAKGPVALLINAAAAVTLSAGVPAVKLDPKIRNNGSAKTATTVHMGAEMSVSQTQVF
jgi:hypothetical protein